MLKHIQNISTMTYSSEKELEQLVNDLNSIKHKYMSHLQLAGELVVAMQQTAKSTANKSALEVEML